MKILDRVAEWPNKVNFVDKNNVLLGYDLEDKCCENATWEIMDTLSVRKAGEEHPQPDSLEDWAFDQYFFCKYTLGGGDYDKGQYTAVFRIVCGEAEKFIYLSNTHNGYYAHGFEFNSAGNVLAKGDL